MITITSEEMKDYRLCPRLYAFRKADEAGWRTQESRRAKTKI